ncbi:transcription factor [Dionaea muscipula]
MDSVEKLQKCNEYIEALEQERQKILVFQRELPLCLQLVTQALDACKQQLRGTGTETAAECPNVGQSEYSGQTTTSDGPILEEFIPVKRTCSSSNDEDHVEEEEAVVVVEELELESQLQRPKISRCRNSNKSDWLRSVQLWNHTPDPPPTTTTTTKEDNQPKKAGVLEVIRNNGGAFQPFQKAAGKTAAQTTTASSACSTAERVELEAAGGATKKDDKEGQSQIRKSRRCWSPELHKRFINALQQLGGSHAATPKQIRELMKVDGLTNDEVKSHLQKYRLHTRRPVAASNANGETPQIVVVSGIWVPPPPPEYAAAAAGSTLGETAAAPAGIYAPLMAAAAPPRPVPRQTSVVGTQRRQKQLKQSNQYSTTCSEERGSQQSDGLGALNSNSSSTSSSSPMCLN